VKGKRRGNCYVTCEALYHLLGGKRSGWKPYTVPHEGDTHWFLGRYYLGPGRYALKVILDPTKKQFRRAPDYSKARGRGFLTKKPSKRARELMKTLVWQ
jgi:hypothetical protein